MGPFDAWPTGGGGFEYFYGFIGGETNQWYPALYEGTTPVEPEKTPEEGYHLTEDLTTKAIKWIRQQKALMPDKPFFIYFAPGATHAPHHVPKEWADKYKGKFDQGWDKLREETFARQKKAAASSRRTAQLTARHPEIPAWDTISAEMKPVLRRQMEIYAGFLEHTDHHVGRLIDALEDLGILDDTLIYRDHRRQRRLGRGLAPGHLQRDGSADGLPAAGDRRVPDGATRQVRRRRGVQPLRGGLGARHGHALPVDQAGRLALGRHPQRHDRALAERHQGQGRDPQPVPSCDRRRADHPGGRRGCPSRCSSTACSSARSKASAWLYSFNDAKAAERHETQYFEMFGNRGIYHKGWTAVTRHRTPWQTGHVTAAAFDDDVWELYDTNTDWTQSKDLAKENPEKLHELQRLWLIEAVKYNVLPLDDRFAERANPDLAGRPQLIKGNRQILFGGMGRLTESSIVNTKNKSHAVTAEVVVPAVRRGGRHRRAGRDHRRLEPLRQGRQAEVLLQLLRREPVHGRGHVADPAGHAPGADGVRVRRRRPGEGRHGHAVRGRQEGRRRARGPDRAHRLLRRRDL